MEYRIRRGRIRKSFRATVTVAILAAVTFFVHADTQRVIQYEYDNAGNITGIRFGTQSSAPVITNVSPDVIGPGNTSTIVVTGNNLLNVSVSTTRPNLSVSNINTSLTSMSFDLTADVEATEGPATFTFTNRFGSADADIFVLEPFIVSLSPNPVVISDNAIPQTVDLVFNRPLNINRTFNFSTDDPAVATVNVASTVLNAGDDRATVQLTGAAEGVTKLNVTSPQLVNQSIDVRVAGAFTGDSENFAPVVNVVVGDFEPIGNIDNPVIAPTVFVSVGIESNLDNPLLAPPVFVSVGTEPVGVPTPTLSSPVPVAIGAELDDGANLIVNRGTTQTISITGRELQSINNVTFSSASGLTVNSVTPNVGGTQLDISITATSTTTQNTRALIISTPDREVFTTTLLRRRITVQ